MIPSQGQPIRLRELLVVLAVVAAVLTLAFREVVFESRSMLSRRRSRLTPYLWASRSGTLFRRGAEVPAVRGTAVDAVAKALIH